MRLIANGGKEHWWKYEGKEDPKPPIRKLQIKMTKDEVPTMDACGVTHDGSCRPLGAGFDMTQPDYCLLKRDNFSVSMTNTAPGCTISVTIVSFLSGPSVSTAR